MNFCRKDAAATRDMLPGVRLQTLVYGTKTLMGRFLLRKGAEIPPHEHPYEQTGILLTGRMTLVSGSDRVEVNGGDSWCIPENEEHSVTVHEDSEVIEVFSPVREDYLPSQPTG